MHLPRGPSFAALQTVRYALGPYPMYRALARRYGDVFTIPTLLGPLVVTGHPDGARALFGARASDVARWATDAASPLVGDSSLILVHGEPHRRTRKLLAPPFHVARMKAHHAVAHAAALRRAARWSDSPFRLLDETLAISLDVAMRAIFGAEDDARAEGLSRAILGAHRRLTPTIMLFRALRRPFLGAGPWARFQRARRALDAMIYAEIAARRAGPPREDILSSMLEARYDDGAPMPDDEIRDQLVTLVFAAHETTGIALTWAFYWLARSPEARERVLAEIEAAPDVHAAPFLDAVCQETLRLHPVIPEVIRRLLAPLEVQGYTIPAGMPVAACTTLVHERADLYEDPHAFRPERFLARTYSPFEYFPFGGGSRRCIGAGFAVAQMKSVLAALLPRWTIEPVDHGPAKTVLRNLSVGPKGGLVVTARARGRLETHAHKPSLPGA